MERNFCITYSTVTPESSEHGNYADSGFISANGIEVSTHDIWGEDAAKIKQDCMMTLREALLNFGHGFGKHSIEDNFDSWRDVNNRESICSPNETLLTLHANDKVSISSLNRVYKLLIG